MTLEEIVRCSRELSETRSRLQKVALLSALLAGAAVEEIPLVVSFLSGRLPRGRVGIGYQSVSEMRRVDAAFESSLDVRDVDRALEELRTRSGSGSAAARADILRGLVRRATADEQDFLARLFLEDLRQGSLEGIMVDAVAKAAGVAAAGVRRALMITGDLGAVARVAISEGEPALARFQVELFRPIRPMLAQTAEDVTEALSTLGEAAVELKLDGARIQVHKSEEAVRIYSRQSNDVTEACPEIVEQMQAIPASSVVLDGEAIALDKKGRPYPFQTTMRRFGRRLDVAAMRRALPLTATFFDLLFVEGEPVIDRPAAERFERLSASLGGKLVVPRLVTSDPVEARRFYDEALEAGHEGVMAKSLEAPYEAGSRGKAWLKVKSAETLDLVVLAAEWGSGRRRGYLSNLHLGARDPETGGFVMLGKTFKGMTDEVLAWQTERLQQIETERDEWCVHVRPELVVEIAFNDLQRSPHYPGGLALRFARLKAYREDKRPEEADTIETVRDIFRRKTGESPDRPESQLELF